MRKSLLTLFSGTAIWLFACTAQAVGLGGIQVRSSLGQPLEAEIELLAAEGKAERASLEARLAAPDVYKGAGLEYPYSNRYTFKIKQHENGKPYLEASSAQPINDPFISLMVELTWSSGRLLREYTFLLDPPGYTPSKPQAAPVEAVAPAVQTVVPTPAASEPAAPVEASVSAAEPSRTKTAPAAHASASSGEVVSGLITVRRGDTLTAIARNNKIESVSLERMLVALYRANEGQFDGRNMNRIRAGKQLRLPSNDELMHLSQTDAIRDIRAQAADWNAYRQRLASTATQGAGDRAARQSDSGKIKSSVADEAPVAKESAQEVLQLSRGEAPGEQGAHAAGASAEEEAIAREKAIQDAEARAAVLEKNLKDMEDLAKLKSEAASAAASAPVASAVATVPVAAPPAEEVPAESGSFLDMLLGEPLYLGGGAAALLALLGLGLVVARRKKAESAPQTPVGEDTITSRMAVPVESSPDTGDFTHLDGEEAGVAATNGGDEEDVDPISEADLFLSFGRDAQAEEVLKEAMLRTPDDYRLHVKMLEIFARRNDTAAFAALAEQVRDSGDAAAWAQAVAMGHKLDPSNSLYGGEGADDIEEMASATMQTRALDPAAPDFLLDDMQDTSKAEPEIDFDLGEADAVAEAMADDSASIGIQEQEGDVPEPEAEPEPEPVDDRVMDFDITSAMPAQQPEAEDAGMDFDVTASHPELQAQDDDDAMDFDITASHPEAGGLEGMDFDIGEAAPVAAATAEAGTPEDIKLDFDLGSATEEPAQAGLAEPEDEIAVQPDAVADTSAKQDAIDASIDDLVFELSSGLEAEPAQASTAADAVDVSLGDVAEASPVSESSAAATPEQEVDFALDLPELDEADPAASVPPPRQDSGLEDISLNLDEGDAPQAAPEEAVHDEHWHEVATKLDLARAYQEMGDETGAREILDEVMVEGDAGQQAAAQALLDQLA